MRNRFQWNEVLVALLAAYMALLPQFYLIFSPMNRHSLLWNRGYHYAILSAVLILAAIYWTGYKLLQKGARNAPVLRHVVTALAVVALIGILVRTVVSLLDRGQVLPAHVQAILDLRVSKAVYYLLLPGVAVLFRPDRCRRFVRATYSILAPVMVIGFVWPLTFVEFKKQDLAPPTALFEQYAEAPVADRNIYIFMFDAWTHDVVFGEQGMLEEMPNLKELLRTATCYHRAYSGGTLTYISVPRFLLQTDKHFASLSPGEVANLTYARKAIGADSIFTHADAFVRVVSGFGLSYEQFVGSSVEHCSSFHAHIAMPQFANVKDLLWTQMAWVRHFGVSLRPEPYHYLVWAEGQKKMHRLALDVIAKLNAPTFAFFHYYVPHWPYVWNREGLKQELPENGVRWSHIVEDYRDNLRYVDTLLGEITGALKATGKFDGALLIVMADHAWREDPEVLSLDTAEEEADPQSRLKHLPLIIKEPYQHQAAEVNTPVYLTDLYPLMEPSLR